MSAAVGVGLVGAGAFGEFCLAAFAALPDVRITAVCDTDAARAERCATQYGAKAYTALDDLLNDPAVEIVALNTPPFLHGSQGLAVLQAGKHLFCEKPLALTVPEVAALIEAAEQHRVHLTVDYVMRRNPLWMAAAAIRENGLLGALLHMDLANHAAGLNLPADHWFWDKSKSGGIWIEHGVHFFDAFAWVSGQPGMITAAQAFTNASGQEDRVEALASYGQTAAHFYHGFTHSSANEQTTARLTFERGYVTLHEWVPTRMELTMLKVDDADIVRPFLPGDIHTEADANGMISLSATLKEGKAAVYTACIQAGLSELAQAVRYPDIQLSVTGEQGLASLRIAVEAESISRQ